LLSSLNAGSGSCCLQEKEPALTFVAATGLELVAASACDKLVAPTFLLTPIFAFLQSFVCVRKSSAKMHFVGAPCRRT